jgi:hypothetical protein
VAIDQFDTVPTTFDPQRTDEVNEWLREYEAEYEEDCYYGPGCLVGIAIILISWLATAGFAWFLLSWMTQSPR